MMRGKRKTFWAVVSLLFIAVGTASLWVGRAIPFTEQWPVYDGLRQTSAIVFGIMGAWAAIVYPNAMTSLLRPGSKLTTEEKRSLNRLLRPMLISTLILAVILVVALIAPVVRHVPWLMSHREWLRGASFGTVGILTVAEILAVALVLLPFDDAKREIDYATSRRDVMRATRPIAVHSEGADEI